MPSGTSTAIGPTIARRTCHTARSRKTKPTKTNPNITRLAFYAGAWMTISNHAHRCEQLLKADADDQAISTAAAEAARIGLA